MASIDGILAHAGKRLPILLCPVGPSIIYLKLGSSQAAKYYRSVQERSKTAQYELGEREVSL